MDDGERDLRYRMAHARRVERELHRACMMLAHVCVHVGVWGTDGLDAEQVENVTVRLLSDAAWHLNEALPPPTRKGRG